MASALHGIGVVTLGCWVSMAVCGCKPQLPSATVVAPQGTTTYHVRDMTGRMITTTVPALGSPPLKLSDPRDGTVQVTVVALHPQRSEATVRTHTGQQLVLTLPLESFASLRVGDRFLLQVVQRTGP
jgi:hypothetical protein